MGSGKWKVGGGEWSERLTTNHNLRFMVELPPPFACKTCTSLSEGGIISSLFEGVLKLWIVNGYH